MEIKYFQDTDMLCIEFKLGGIVELDENTVIDLDSSGIICATTLEHAKNRTDIRISPLSKLLRKALNVPKPFAPSVHGSKAWLCLGFWQKFRQRRD